MKTKLFAIFLFLCAFFAISCDKDMKRVNPFDKGADQSEIDKICKQSEAECGYITATLNSIIFQINCGECPTGYECSNNKCFDIDECENPYLNSCPEHSTCANKKGTYTCVCDDNYTWIDSECVEVPEEEPDSGDSEHDSGDSEPDDTDTTDDSDTDTGNTDTGDTDTNPDTGDTDTGDTDTGDTDTGDTDTGDTDIGDTDTGDTDTGDTTPDTGDDSNLNTGDTSGNQAQAEEVGAACTSDSQCTNDDDQDATCLTSDDGFPGGYCTFFGDETDSAACSSTGELFYNFGGNGLCLHKCTKPSDCRQDYRCSNKIQACLPDCKTVGYECVYGECDQTDGVCLKK